MHVLIDGKTVEVKDEIKVVNVDVHLDETGDGEDGPGVVIVKVREDEVILVVENTDGDELAVSRKTYQEIAEEL